MSFSSSSSKSSGQSTGTPSNMYSAQSAAALAIAQASASLGEYTFNWALNNYSTTTAMTDQAVGNYLQMSQTALGLTQQQLQQYQNIYEPENAELANLAGTYSSAARQGVNAGMAESQSEQGTVAGLNAAKQNLQSYGIDPSSGMYGELEEAQQAGGGAAAAGSGNAAILSTAAAGRQLLQSSIQVGEQQPGDIVNDLNAAYQGVAGAENSTLANAQTGANLLDSANPFLSTAMQLKYPPIGNTTQSTQGSTSNSVSTPQMQQQPQRTPTAQPGGGVQPGGFGSGDGPNNANGSGVGTDTENSGGTANPGIMKQGSSAGIQNIPDDPGSTSNTPYGGDSAFGGPPADTGAYTSGDSAFGGPPDTFSDTSTGAIPDMGNMGAFGMSPAIPSMPSSDASSSGGGGYSPAPPAPANSGGGGYTDQSNVDTYDNSGGGGGGGGGGSYGGYSTGGTVRPHPHAPMRNPLEASGGGKVPMSASPSAGAATDDVSARVEPDEFIVPKDVVKWKGQEYFQKLIAQSRKARVTGSPAKPQAKAPLPGQQPSQQQQQPQQGGI